MHAFMHVWEVAKAGSPGDARVNSHEQAGLVAQPTRVLSAEDICLTTIIYLRNDRHLNIVIIVNAASWNLLVISRMTVSSLTLRQH